MFELVQGQHGSSKFSSVTTGYTAVYTPADRITVKALGKLTAPTPKISGTAKVGAKLTAKPGTWGPKPVTLKYQWKVAGKAVSKATKSTFTVPASAKGKKVTVTVTGSKTGYKTVAKTSAPNRLVGPAGRVRAPGCGHPGSRRHSRVSTPGLPPAITRSLRSVATTPFRRTVVGRCPFTLSA